MKKEKIHQLIEDWYFDFNNLHGNWDRGKIDDKEMLKFMANLAFSFLRTLADDSLSKIRFKI